MRTDRVISQQMPCVECMKRTPPAPNTFSVLRLQVREMQVRILIPPIQLYIKFSLSFLIANETVLLQFLSRRFDIHSTANLNNILAIASDPL